jgi:hypothetical protein
MSDTMLTTIDNPYSPFDEYPEWYAFDEAHGYHTPSFLARIVKSSDEMSEADQEAEIDRAIQEIISENVLGLWTTVTRP